MDSVSPSAFNVATLTANEKLGKAGWDLPRGFERHAPLSATNPNRICWLANTAPVIRNETLARAGGNGCAAG